MLSTSLCMHLSHVGLLSYFKTSFHYIFPLSCPDLHLATPTLVSLHMPLRKTFSVVLCEEQFLMLFALGHNDV